MNRNIFIIFALLSSCKLYSQQTELDPVTVTASLQQRKVSETGRNIITIKGEQFNSLPFHSIDDLLRYLPGVEVQQRGAMGAQADILIRGGTFQQVLVILDGIRLNDPLIGHFNSYIPIAPAEIDRVEIVKGASSAIYGTEAVGGVIQIITKSFNAKQDKKINGASAQLTGGEYGLLNLNAGGIYQLNKTVLSAGVISNNADGQPQRGIHGYIHNNTFSASLKQFLKNDWSLALRSAYDSRDFAAQNFYTAFTSDTATEKVNSWWNHLKLAHKQDFSFDIGYKMARDNYDFSKGATANLNKSKILQALGVYNYKFLTAGAQFINRSIVSNDRGDHSVSQAGAFIVMNKDFNAFHVSPAIRFDYNEIYGSEFVPQLNLSYTLHRLILRGSAGKTTRNADFTELYNNYNKTLVTSGNIGNPGLQAEHSFSWEAGADYYLDSKFKIAATYFRKDYRRLIDWVNTTYSDMPRKDNLSSTGNYFLAKNTSDVMTEGVETDLYFTVKNLYSSLGLVWINSDSPTASLYISSHAKFLLNYSVNYSFRFLSIAVNGIYKQRTPQTGNAALAEVSPDYFLLNVRVTATIIKRVGLFVQADNLFDRKYADRFGSLMPGRWVMAGVRFN
jgi:vitamin B12 transporter